jgi:hypothetical protein
MNTTAGPERSVPPAASASPKDQQRLPARIRGRESEDGN